MFWQINLYCTFEKGESSWAAVVRAALARAANKTAESPCPGSPAVAPETGTSLLFPPKGFRWSPVHPSQWSQQFVPCGSPALVESQIVSEMHLLGGRQQQCQRFAFSSNVHSWVVMPARYHPCPKKSLTLGNCVIYIQVLTQQKCFLWIGLKIEGLEENCLWKRFMFRFSPKLGGRKKKEREGNIS